MPNGQTLSQRSRDYYEFIIIIPPQSTAGHRLEMFDISLNLRLLAYAVSTSELVYPNGSRSTAVIASPLPLQRANTVCYVGNSSSLSDHLVSDSIPQRNPEHSPSIIRWATLNLWTSRAVSVHVSAPYVMTGRTYWLKTLSLGFVGSTIKKTWRSFTNAAQPTWFFFYLPRLQSYFLLTAVFARGRHIYNNYEDSSANYYFVVYRCYVVVVDCELFHCIYITECLGYHHH
jgi:hypothetical protein